MGMQSIFQLRVFSKSPRSNRLFKPGTTWSVLLFVLGVNACAQRAYALGKPAEHCSHGLCLFLMPGERTGVVKPKASITLITPNETEAAAVSPEVSPLGNARRLLKNKKDEKTGSTQDAPIEEFKLTIPEPTEKFLKVYFPTLPQSGALHLRKLWEGCTGVVTEMAGTGVGLALNPRTNAFAPECGGVHLMAANESFPPASETEQCGRIVKGTGSAPVLIKSNEPLEFVSPVLKESADVILMLVRNPVDAYQSLFQEKNPKYAASKNLDDVEWPVPFSQYLNEQWEKYVNSFDDVQVPRVVMRYEDMWRDPEDFMKEVLVFTGTAQASAIDSAHVENAVRQVQKATKLLHPSSVVGEGFEVMMSLQKSDQQLAMSVLNSFNATLKALGYAFYFEADGIPKELKDMTKRQGIEESQRLDALRDAGFDVHALLSPEFHRDVSYGIMFAVALMSVCAGWLMCMTCTKGIISTAKGFGESSPNTKESGIRWFGNVFRGTDKFELEKLKSQLREKMGSGRSKKVYSKGSDILEEAKSVMSRTVETPAEKLARLKALRNKLAEVRD